jgi:hypothetical protein
MAKSAGVEKLNNGGRKIDKRAMPLVRQYF